MKELEQAMKEHQIEMEEMEDKIKELEQNRPPLGKYGRQVLRYIHSLDNYRYFQLLISESLFPKVLERESQAQEQLRTIIEQQGALEKVEEIPDLLEKAAVRRRIKQEADSIVMREIVLQPM